MSIPRLLPSAVDGSGTVNLRRNGVGYLTDCKSCIVTEELNKSYTLKLEYPHGGNHWEQITEGAYIVCKPNDLDPEQAFKITGVKKVEHGFVSVTADHVSRQAKESLSTGFYAISSTSFIDLLQENLLKNNCTFSTDFYVQGNFHGENKPPRSAWSLLQDGDDSFLGLYGGELAFDNFDIKIMQNRGENRGLVIQQGINASEVSVTEEYQTPSTAFYPYWFAESIGYVELPEKVISTNETEPFDTNSVQPLDLTFDFDEKPSVVQLRERAMYWIQKKSGEGRKEQIKVRFVDTQKAGEAKKMRIPVMLADTVRLNAKGIGIKSTLLKVVKLSYDVLSNRVIEIGVGDRLPDLADYIINLTRR